MDVGFRDLTYTVHKWYKFGESPKTILHGLSGTFKSGRLTAILGPSGAGKSSLLNVLSGYRRSGVGGELLLGGAPRDEAHFRRVSCYLMQEDLVQPLLTVREHMLLAAELKMPARCGRRHRVDTIEDILKMLGLWEVRGSRTESLSGGQKKRLCVALELVNNPPVFFLDEPTSGLDEVSAKQCVRLLRDLSRQGRAVVCTLHTPSASLLSLLDDVYVVARGRCVYHGPSAGIVSFLDDSGLSCPVTYNPADFLIEVMEAPDDEDTLVMVRLCEAVENGRRRWDVEPTTDADQGALVTSNGPGICGDGDSGGKGSSDSYSESGSSENDHQLVNTASYNKLQPHTCDRPISRWRQFCLLSQRMLIQTCRNKGVLIIQLLHHFACAILLGLTFLKRANDGSIMFEHLKFCITVVVFHTYTWCMVQVIIFPIEAKLAEKEHLNRWYCLSPYYMAVQLTRLPFLIFLSLIFLSISYVLVGLPMDVSRFLLYTAVGVIVSIASEGMGTAIGAVFSVTNGCAVAPAAIAPFIGLAVYGFDFAHQIPTWMNLLMPLSFIRSGVVSLVLILFGLGRPDLECKDVYCHYADPRVVLRMLGISETSLWTPISYLIGITLTFRILGYIGLRTRLSTK